MGSAVIAQAMPTPSMNCHVIAPGPIQPSSIDMPAAATQPNARGVPSASPAAMLLSRAMRPGLCQVQFDPGNPDKNHDCPPRDAVQGLHDRWAENERVIFRENRAQDAGAQQDAGDDLHYHQWRVVIGPAHPPDQVGDSEDDRHGDQE